MKNQIAVSNPARLTAVAISIAPRPFKFREISVSISTRTFVFSIHSFGYSTVQLYSYNIEAAAFLHYKPVLNDFCRGGEGKVL